MEIAVNQTLQNIIEPVLDDMGYEIVRISMTGSATKTLQIMAERIDRKEMTVQDCADISRNISAILDVEDPIKEQYTLEVSSPGLDRPLVKIEDFSRFSGYEAKIHMRTAVIEQRKKFRGKILEVTKDRNIKISLENNGEIELPYDDITKAKIVLTDELIQESLKKKD